MDPWADGRPVYAGELTNYGLGSVNELDTHLTELFVAMAAYHRRAPKLAAMARRDREALRGLREALPEILLDLHQLRALRALYVRDVTGWFS
jgi:hypothetical protein